MDIFEIIALLNFILGNFNLQSNTAQREHQKETDKKLAVIEDKIDKILEVLDNYDRGNAK